MFAPRSLFATLSFLAAGFAPAAAQEFAPADKLPPVQPAFDFAKDVRDLLEERCVHCHNAEKSQGGLRLDTEAHTRKGGREYEGKVIIPGKSADSAIVHLTARLIDEFEMPPKGKGEALTKEQIGKLRAWIDAGAPWPKDLALQPRQQVEIAEHERIPPLEDPTKRGHWAFKAPVRPDVPAVRNAGWVRNPIDAFILARLEMEGLQPSAEADRITLCRRLYLDLIGLPPTPEEVDQFVRDAASDSLERLVEKLLASPHYGERWGRHWLDAARYADSDGYEKDKPRIAHFYRDWVIGAFNRDLPYDRFIIEQLAGDQLPGATQDQIVATGFLRNSLLNEEGGVDPEQFRMEAMFDRIDCIGKAVLGLTIQCAQCHDHKYDPISQADYYRLFAFLNNDYESQPRVYSAEELMKRADIFRQIGEEEARLKHQTPDWEERMAKWEEELRAQPAVEWQIVQPLVDKNATGGQRYLPLPDGSLITAGFQTTKSTCLMTLETEVKGITGFRIEMLHHPDLPAEGPGRSFMGTFGLSEFKVEKAPPTGKPEEVKFVQATADLSAPERTPVHPSFNEKKPVERFVGPASYAIDGNKETSWSSDLGPGRRNLESTIVFAAEKPINPEGGVKLNIRLVQNMGGWNANDLHAAQLGRFRISITTTPNPVANPVPPHVRKALEVPRDRRSPHEQAVIFSHWRTLVPEWAEANARIEKLWAQHPEGTTQMTLRALPEPRTTMLLKRGDWLKPDQPVAPGVPEILHPLPENAPPTRLTFARWLVDKKSPTTARAFVNRVWQAYFGTGLLEASEDFGTQSEPPSHPALLDWLACEFMDREWSIKALHRLIATSATYRQSSRVTPELRERDPFNRLLARGPRFRVEGEVVRDIQLAASGLLNRKLGGRSVMPPAPEFLFRAPASYAEFPWKEETGENRYRRAVYTYRRRTTMYPFLQAFDTPDGNTSCVRRVRSNTPLQALVALNETVSMEAARALALRMLESEAKTDSERIAVGFRRVLLRPPTDAEIQELLGLLERQTKRLVDGQLDPHLLAVGRADAKLDLPNGAAPIQLAAYTIISRVLLNLDEAFTKE